jgi:hypothetical protein
VPTPADFWTAVDTKLEHALFFCTGMMRVFESQRMHYEVAVFSASHTIRGTNWHTRIYANLDAFLARTRSVPDIIRACFGWDPVLDGWLKTLSTDEQTRRLEFSSQFKPAFDAFRDLPLSKSAQGNVLHRTGETGTEVEITTWYGQP